MLKFIGLMVLAAISAALPAENAPFSERFVLYGYGQFSATATLPAEGKATSTFLNPLLGVFLGFDISDNDRVLIEPRLVMTNGLFAEEMLDAQSIASLMTGADSGEISHEMLEKMQMAHLDFGTITFTHKFSDLLSVKAGKFYTPAGLFGETRDSRILLPYSFLPHIYRAFPTNKPYPFSLFPFSSIGLQLGGSVSGFAYKAYVTNGRDIWAPDNTIGLFGPIADSNNDKGVGTRLSYATLSTEIALSAYTDENAQQSNTRQTSGLLSLRSALPGVELFTEGGLTHFSANPSAMMAKQTGWGIYALAKVPFQKARFAAVLGLDILDPDVSSSGDMERKALFGMEWKPSTNYLVRLDFSKDLPEMHAKGDLITLATLNYAF